MLKQLQVWQLAINPDTIFYTQRCHTSGKDAVSAPITTHIEVQVPVDTVEINNSSDTLLLNSEHGIAQEISTHTINISSNIISPHAHILLQPMASFGILSHFLIHKIQLKPHVITYGIVI